MLCCYIFKRTFFYLGIADMEDILPGTSSRVVIFDNAYHVSDNVWMDIDMGPLECFGASRLLHI